MENLAELPSGRRLSYVERGTGRPLLLLAPGPGLDGSVFLPELGAIDGVCTIALDLPGNGASHDGDPSTWSLSTYAAAAREFAEHFGIAGDYVLLGHSFGGFVAMQSVVDAPGHAAAVIASCTDASETEVPEAAAEPDYPEEVMAEVERGFALEKEAQTPEQCRDAWLLQMPHFAADPRDPGRYRERFATLTYRVEPHRSRDWGDLEALDALGSPESPPVLAIGATNDRAIPPQAARRIADAARDGTYVEVDGGHFPWLDDPEAYRAAVRDFVLRSGR